VYGHEYATTEQVMHSIREDMHEQKYF
jgi:hypothetical protein